MTFHTHKRRLMDGAIVLKDADNADPVAVVQTALESLTKSVGDRLTALEGKVTPKADDKSEKKDADVDTTKALSDRLDKIEATIKRPGATDKKDDEVTPERKAFQDYLRLADRAPDLKTLTVSSDPGAGYFAPREFSDEFLKEVTELSPILRLASVRNTGSPSVIYPTRTGVTNATWHGETQTRTESEPAFGQREVVTKQISTWVPISDMLLADSGGVAEREVRLALQDDFSTKLSTAFMRGSGNLDPEGILTNSEIANVKTGNASTLGTDPAGLLIDTIYQLSPTDRAQAVILANGKTIASLRKLKDSVTGTYLWQPALQLGQPASLVGLPVYEDPFIDDIGSGKTPIIIGNIGRLYRVLWREQMSLKVDPFTAAQQGITKFFATLRVGGRVIAPTAALRIKCST